MDHEISGVLARQAATSDGTTPASRLRSSWAELVELLALGPEAEMQRCPICKRVGMRAATLCGYCWTKLLPPSERGA